MNIQLLSTANGLPLSLAAWDSDIPSSVPYFLALISRSVRIECKSTIAQQLLHYQKLLEVLISIAVQREPN